MLFSCPIDGLELSLGYTGPPILPLLISFTNRSDFTGGSIGSLSKCKTEVCLQYLSNFTKSSFRRAGLTS